MNKLILLLDVTDADADDNNPDVLWCSGRATSMSQQTGPS